MKSKYLSAAAALLCAAGLAGCGGSGNGSMSVPVSVVGLDRPGLVLQNNGGDDLKADAAGSYYFSALLAPDSAFKVSILTTPAGVTCTLANNTGKVNYYTVYTPPTVSCTPVPYTLGGSVTGLKGNGLVLANGSLRLALVAGSTSWEFGSKINNGAVYGITVLVQPDGQTCTVANGTGTMPQANVSNVVVTCQ